MATINHPSSSNIWVFWGTNILNCNICDLIFFLLGKIKSKLFIVFLFCVLGAFPANASDWNPVSVSLTSSYQYPADTSATISPFRISVLSGEHGNLYGFDVGPTASNRINGNLYGIQVGSINSVEKGYGIQLGWLYSRSKAKFSGIQIGALTMDYGCRLTSKVNSYSFLFQVGFFNLISPFSHNKCRQGSIQFGFMNSVRDISGVQFGLLNGGEEFSGLQIGAFNGTQNHQGVQFSIINITDQLTGFQGGVFVNGSKNSPFGIQVAFINSSSETISGAQIGIVNGAGKLTGIQAGIINVAEQLNGLQIGVINAITDPQRSFPATAPVRVFPIVNWSFG